MLKSRQLTKAILFLIAIGLIFSISIIGFIHLTRAKKLHNIDYSAKIIPEQKRYSCTEGDRITISLTIKNLGKKGFKELFIKNNLKVSALFGGILKDKSSLLEIKEASYIAEFLNSKYIFEL